jgi:hypothetical protein
MESAHKPSHGIYINAALLFLALHLFTVNARLLAHLNIDSKTAGSVFDFANLQLDNIIAMVISLSYSMATAIMIKLAEAKRYQLILIWWFAIIDGLGVFIYYSVFTNFQKLGAIYYGIYTASIILAIGMLQTKQEKVEVKKSNSDNQITVLRKQMYKRKRNLKYSGFEVEKDKQVMELKSKIKALMDK